MATEEQADIVVEENEQTVDGSEQPTDTVETEFNDLEALPNEAPQPVPSPGIHHARSEGPSASGTFARQLVELVSERDLNKVIATQNRTMVSFRRTNQTLSTFNDFSVKRFNDVHRQFEAHTRMLIGMKADLDSIFRRIRTLQAKLAKQYPKAFEEVARA